MSHVARSLLRCSTATPHARLCLPAKALPSQLLVRRLSVRSPYGLRWVKKEWMLKREPPNNAMHVWLLLMNGCGLIGVLLSLNSLRSEEIRRREGEEDASFYRSLSRVDALSAKLEGPSTELEAVLHYFQELKSQNSRGVFPKLDSMVKDERARISLVRKRLQELLHAKRTQNDGWEEEEAKVLRVLVGLGCGVTKRELVAGDDPQRLIELLDRREAEQVRTHH